MVGVDLCRKFQKVTIEDFKNSMIDGSILSLDIVRRRIN